MNKTIKIAMCFFMFFMLFGCKQETEIEHPSNEEIEAEKQEKEKEAYEAVEAEKLISFYVPSKPNEYNGAPMIWNNETYLRASRKFREFALKDYYCCIEKGENEIVSPLSLYYVLAMLANAAEGTTRDEMQTVLGMTVDDLNNFLSEFDAVYDREMDPLFRKANALWFNTDLGQLKKDYVDTINKYYGDNINEGSFSDKNKIIKDVNAWSSKQTDGAIDEIVKDEDIKEDTIFLMLNAMTAGGEWNYQFNSKETFYEEFNCYDNTHSLVEMMHQTLFGYWSDERSEGFAKELWNGLDFVAIIPKLGVDIYDYINLMDADVFSNYIKSVHYQDVVGSFVPDWEGWDGSECPIVDEHYTNLSFPKFKFEREYDLEEPLKKMGLANIFDPSKCDFSRMDDGPVYVQVARQKCMVEVDEEKAMAAAVTMMGGGKGAGDCIQVRDKIYHDVIFDRPFLFAFINADGQTPLFIGLVNNIGEPIEKAFQIQNITGKINIRSLPSTSGEKVGTFEKGKIIYAFETKEAEGYTWYRIGTDKWVADKNKEWIKVL